MEKLVGKMPDRLTPYDGHDRRQPNIILTLLMYTVLFCVMAAGVYFMFYDQQRTLVHFGETNKDAFSERYIFIFEFQRFLQNLIKNGTLNTWDWSIGLGADGYSFNVANLTNPLNWITLYHPEKYADITYSISILLRLYFSGFFFIFFARKLGLSGIQVMLGALLYAFSPWNIVASLSQGAFTIGSMLLPPVMLGVEKIIRRESPLLLILSVAFAVLSAFSIAYMIAFITLLYYFVRYFTCEYIQKSFFGFIKTTLALLISGSAGIALSGFGLYVLLLKFGSSTASTGREVPLHFEITEYLRFPLRLIDFNAFFGSNSVIGVSAIGIIMIPAIIYLFFRRRTNAIMTAVLLVASLIPYVNSAFNFFSYESGRWMFALALFYTLAAVECLDEKILGSRKIRISMLVTFGLYSAYLAWIQKILNEAGKYVLMINWATCVILIILIEAVFVLWGSELSHEKQQSAEPMASGKYGRTVFGTLCIAIMLLTCAGLTASYNAKYAKSMKGFLAVGKSAEKLSKSSQRIGTVIDDNDFYRIDQLGDLLGTWAPHCKVNEAMYYGNRSNYGFYSSVDSSWLTYNKLLGNNMGYYKRVAPNSNDNRFGIDLLQGTKYFIGNDKNAINVASDYAGHSFSKCMEYEGIELLKNKYDIGIGCLFTKYMREEEWMKLTYPERELAMLEAVVIKDGQTPPIGLTEIEAADLKGTVKELDKKVNEMGWVVDLSAQNDGKHQLILSFENIRSSINGRMTLTADNGKLYRTVINTIRDNRGFSDIKDLTVNMGYDKKAADNIRVIFTPNGPHPDTVSFKYDDIHLWAVPLEEYDTRAKRLSADRIKTEAFYGDYYRGSVTCDGESVLYLSVPDDKGWEIYVDGKKTKKREAVDIAFTGVDLTEGRHTIELKYHSYGFWQGCLVTLVGLVLTVIIMSVYGRIRYAEEYDDDSEDDLEEQTPTV